MIILIFEMAVAEEFDYLADEVLQAEVVTIGHVLNESDFA